MKHVLMGVLCGMSLCSMAGIMIDPASRTFAKVGGAGTILTSGEGTWTATTDVDWISIKPRTSGNSGVSCVYVVSKNMTADTRTGVVTVSGNAHTVTQTGYEATVSPLSAMVDMTGGEGTIAVSVDAGVAWSVVCAESWVSFATVSGSGNGTVRYTVSPYDGIVSRSASVQIAGNVFVITQTGKDVELSLATAYVECEAGIVDVGVTSLDATKWSAVPQVEWISIADGNTGKGDSTLLIAYAANESFLERTGTVKIGSETFTLHQKGVEKVALSLSQDVAVANPNGAYGEINVSATLDGPWTVKSLASWLTLASNGGVGNGMIEYVASANKTLEPREGFLQVQPLVRTPDPDLYAGLVYWHTGFEAPRWEDQNPVFWNYTSGVRGELKLWTCDPGLWEHGYMDCGGGHVISGVYSNAFAEADGYAIAIEIALAELNRINRLLQAGELSLYLDEENYLCVNGMRSAVAISESSSNYNVHYTIVLSQKTDGILSVYVGRTGQKLAACLEVEKPFAFENFPKVDFGTEVKFGATSLPSPGGLKDARIYDVRVWARKLSDEELKNADVGMKCLGDVLNEVPVGSGWWRYLPLDGNVAMQTNQNVFVVEPETPFSTNCIVSECYPCSNRFGVASRALKCSYQDTTSHTDVYEWKGVTIPTCKSVSFWFYVGKLPLEAQSIITRKDALNRGYDGKVLLSIGPNGLESDLRILVDANHYLVNKWHMLAVVDGVVHFDGMEVGWISNAWSYGYPNPRIRIGCFDGKIDDCYFSGFSIKASDVRALYEATKPDIRTVRVTQGIIEPGVSPGHVSAAAAAGNYSVKLTMGKGVNWTASPNVDWLTLRNSSSGAGSATISFDVAANPRAEKRTGTLTVAGLTVTVTQDALVSEVENDTPFPPCEDGGYGFITVTTEAGALWQAVSDVPWLTIIDDGEHSGSDMIMWAVDPYTDVTQSRMGTITVADHKIYITQRGYQLSVEPQNASASSRGAVGQIDVTTDAETAVWTAQPTEDWIHIQGTGTGGGLHGSVRYTLDDNDTGVSRSGSIMVAGVEYVVTQSARVTLATSVSGHGVVLGGGEYDANSNVVLTAVADAGYVFSSWSGDAFGVTSNITVMTDTQKNVTATFIPESAAQQIVKDRGGAAEGMYTREQIHALEVGNLLLDVDASTGKARVGVKLMETSDLSNPNWQPVEMTTDRLDVGSDGSVGLNVPASGNAKFYKVVVPGNDLQ